VTVTFRMLPSPKETTSEASLIVSSPSVAVQNQGGIGNTGQEQRRIAIGAVTQRGELLDRRQQAAPGSGIGSTRDLKDFGAGEPGTHAQRKAHCNVQFSALRASGCSVNFGDPESSLATGHFHLQGMSSASTKAENSEM